MGKTFSNNTCEELCIVSLLILLAQAILGYNQRSFVFPFSYAGYRLFRQHQAHLGKGAQRKGHKQEGARRRNWSQQRENELSTKKNFREAIKRYRKEYTGLSQRSDAAKYNPLSHSQQQT